MAETKAENKSRKGSVDADPFWGFINRATETVASRIEGIDAPTMRMVMALRRATETIFYDLHVVLNMDGTISSTGAMRVLLVLYTSGPLKSQDIAHFTGMSRAQISALVDTMATEGVINRRDDENDRRSMRIEITEEGCARFEDYFRTHAARERKWFDVLSDEEKETVFSIFDKVMRAHSGDKTFYRRK